ncbi:MAG: hypothetical protein ACRCWQ_05660, partial [Bacilli bacterium]
MKNRFERLLIALGVVFLFGNLIPSIILIVKYKIELSKYNTDERYQVIDETVGVGGGLKVKIVDMLFDDELVYIQTEVNSPFRMIAVPFTVSGEGIVPVNVTREQIILKYPRNAEKLQFV